MRIDKFRSVRQRQPACGSRGASGILQERRCSKNVPRHRIEEKREEKALQRGNKPSAKLFLLFAEDAVRLTV